MLLERMKKRREDLRLSQEALGKKIGVTGKTIWRLENGERESKSSALLQIASALDTSVAYLMGETEDPTPHPIDPATEIKSMTLGLTQSARKRMEKIENSPMVDTSVNGRVADPEKILSGDHKGLIGWLRERGKYVSDDTVALPIVSPELTACCGKGLSIPDCTSESTETMIFDRRDIGNFDDLNPPYVIHFEGSSMEGYGIPYGAKCVVNPLEEVASGEIAFIKFGDDTMIKKVYWRREGAELKSSDGETIMVSREDFESGWVQILGKVMTVTWKP